jgi:hypothetical protein
MEHPLLLINVKNIVEAIITKWIVNKTLKLDLKYCLHMMQQIPIKDYHIYTDGSLDTSEFNVTGHVVMSAVVPESHYIKIMLPHSD